MQVKVEVFVSKKRRAKWVNLESDSVFFSDGPRDRCYRDGTKGGAAEMIGGIWPGCEIFGFTKGQFEMLDLIEHLLGQTGPASVDIMTWSAAVRDIERLDMIHRIGRITSMRWILDFSFPSLRKDCFEALVGAFGVESIRTTRMHAKIVNIRNDDWNLVVRSSMNLNKNPRFESIEISDDAQLADFVDVLFCEVFEQPDVGEVVAMPEVNKMFRGGEDAPVVQVGEFAKIDFGPVDL